MVLRYGWGGGRGIAKRVERGCRWSLVACRFLLGKGEGEMG
jgi:hypothetical protein